MNDFFGRVPSSGDRVVYPVVRYGELVLHDALVVGHCMKNGKPALEVLVNREGKRPWATTLICDGRFLVVSK